MNNQCPCCGGGLNVINVSDPMGNIWAWRIHEVNCNRCVFTISVELPESYQSVDHDGLEEKLKECAGGLAPLLGENDET